MWTKYGKRPVLALALCLFAFGAAWVHGQLYLSDFPVNLPPYDRNGLAIGIVGEIHAEIDFKKGKAVRVRVLDSRLTIPDEHPLAGDSIANTILENVTRITTEPLAQWRSYVLSRYTEKVVIRLRTDPDLEGDQRRYDLQLDLNDGVPTEVVISGPEPASDKPGG